MRINNLSCKGICLLLIFLFTHTANAQDTLRLSVNQLFELVIQNNPSLKVARQNVAVFKQDVKASKNNRLPNANITANAFYLSDVNVFSPDFKNSVTQKMPHFGNRVNIDVNQVIWTGGRINESIKLSEQQVEIANLELASAEQETSLTSLGYYLDLFKLYNQSQVYQKNIELAKRRLQNVNSMHNQGMVTNNDVIRVEMQISNLGLSKLSVDNSITIFNKQLNVALGITETIVIIPIEDILSKKMMVERLDDYQQLAKLNNPQILLSKKVVDIGRTSVNIARKNNYPTLSAFVGNSLERPLSGSSPVRDMYMNAWNIGLSLSYDIGSLWKNKQNIRKNILEREKAIAQLNETEAMIGIGVQSAFIQFNEANMQKRTLATNVQLSVENYRIMEKKYNNQLAIVLDLIDASNAKLDAELQYINAEVNIIYSYYKLLKEIGEI